MHGTIVVVATQTVFRWFDLESIGALREKVLTCSREGKERREEDKQDEERGKKTRTKKWSHAHGSRGAFEQRKEKCYWEVRESQPVILYPGLRAKRGCASDQNRRDWSRGWKTCSYVPSSVSLDDRRCGRTTACVSAVVKSLSLTFTADRHTVHRQPLPHRMMQTHRVVREGDRVFRYVST